MSEPAITSGEHTWYALKALHRQMLTLAEQSIERIPRDERDLSGLTLTLSQIEFDTVKEWLAELRSKAASLSIRSNTSDATQRVYQLSFQLFPLTISAR